LAYLKLLPSTQLSLLYGAKVPIANRGKPEPSALSKRYTHLPVVLVIWH